jgi:hypothetical protein
MPVCSCIFDFLARLTAVIGFFLGGGGWKRSLYEVRTTHGDDGEYDDDDDDDDGGGGGGGSGDEVVAGRSDDKGKVGLENMCFAFAQIVIVVYLVHFPVPIPLFYIKTPTNLHS